MGNYCKEHICERCSSKYIAKMSRQIYCIKCGNLVYKENSKKDSERKKLATKLRRERLFKKEV